VPTRPEGCAAPEDITTQYLDQVLKHAGYNASVADFTAATVGTGQVGQNVRFELTYAKGIGPSSLVGKFASANPVSRATGMAMNTYLKEVRFYQQLQPMLDICVPKVLFTEINPATQEFVLMMEDLAPAAQGNQLTGCSLEQVRLGLDQLARLHGPRWADASLYEHEWLNRADPENVQMGSVLYTQLYPGFVERYGARLTPEFIEMGAAFGDLIGAYLAPSNGPITVVHGDFRLDNMMFGGPYPLAVVDWQTPALGCGCQDVAYFIGTSLAPELRREHDQRLLEIYYAALNKYAIDDYSLEACQRDYAHFSFAGWNMAVIASMIVGQTERGDAMFMAMAARSAQMAIDLNALNLLRNK
jgi:hypothetical protein